MATLTDKTTEDRMTRLVVGATVAAVLSGVFLFHGREPVYLDKPAGEWIEGLGDNSTAASLALREMGPAAVAPLIRALERKPSRWLDAYVVVVNHSPPFLKPKLATHYLNLARRETRIPRVRAGAAQTLGDLGPVAREAAPALVKALADRDATLRLNAAFALGKIRASPDLAVPALSQLLHDSNEEVRMYAAIALKKFGAQAALAVPGLITTLNDHSWQVRERSALALGAVGRNRPGVVAALEQAMLDQHRFVRSSAATALASLAPQTRSARAALEQARYDPDAEVRYSAGLAMDQIDSETRGQNGLK